MSSNNTTQEIDIDDVDAIIRKNNYKLTADKIKQILSKVLNDPSQSAKRWVWELMQNAKDVKNKFDQVSVEIQYTGDKLIFRHNGDPFSIDNITGLIQQVSSKNSNNSDEEVTGKFGTGFIATHLLSEIIKVDGIVNYKNKHREFNVVLDRSGRTSEELLPKIKDALEKIRHIDTDPTFCIREQYESGREEENYDTVFSYELLHQEKKDAVRDGIADLENTLPLTLVNVPKIKCVKIIDETKSIVTIYKSEDIYKDDKIRKTKINISNSDPRYFITYYTEELSLSVEVSDFDSLEMIEHFGKTPNLYRDFPLIGSDKFYFPYIFNGYKLHPTEDRDGIPFHSESAPDHLENRKLIELAFDAAKIFTNYLLEIGAKNLYVCALSRFPDEKWQTASKNRYESLLKDYRSFLNERLLIETTSIENEDDKNLELGKAFVPYYGENEKDRFAFYDVVSPFIGANNIPKKSLLQNWIKVSGPKEELDNWGREFRYTIINLLQELESLQNIDALSDKMQNNLQSTKWLNSLYAFLIEYKETDSFKEYAIIPNQNGDFKKLTPNTLHLEDKDANIPDEFLDILNVLGDNWRDKLVHRDVELPGQNIERKDLPAASLRINDLIKNKEFKTNPDYFKIIKNILRNVTSLDNTSNFRIEIFLKGSELLNFEERPRVVSNIKGFNFNFALDIFIEYLNEKIESLEDIFGLSEQLKRDKPTSVIWLDKYLKKIISNQEYFKHIYYGNIVPNRYEEFCAYEDLKNFGTKDSPLDEDLIYILNTLNTSEDWNKELVLDGININCQPKIFDELATAIDSAIIEIEKQDAVEIGYINSYKDAIFNLIEWCNQNENRSNYLKHFKQRKNDLWVKFSMTDEILSLIKDEDALETLRLLRKSNVSKEQLNNLLDLYPEGIPQNLIDFAKEDSRKKKEFNNLLTVGSKVEELFIETLKEYNVLSNKNDIIHAGGGSYDIRIYNQETKKSFYIELKSCKFQNTDPINIAISQAKRAVKELENENFAIVVVERANENVMDENYIKNNCKYFKNPGEYLGDIVEDFNIIEEASSRNEKAVLKMDNAEFKGSLDYKWLLNKVGTLGFKELIDDVNTILLSKE